MDTDDIAPPPKKPPAPMDLQGLSIADLEARIAHLQAEIIRAQEMIVSKQKVRGSAEGLFKR